jgi:hypothetical protein
MHFIKTIYVTRIDKKKQLVYLINIKEKNGDFNFIGIIG